MRKSNAGRKPIKITKKIIARAESLAAQGLTYKQIAQTLGMSYQTLNEKGKEYSEFSDAIDSGRAKGISTITNALFKKAEKGDGQSMQFYLKNRDRAEWGERKAMAPTIDFTFDSTLPPNEQAAQIMQAAADGKLPSDIAQNYMNMIASTVKIDEMTAMAEKLKGIEKLLGVEHG